MPVHLDNSPLHFHHLSFLDEGDEVVVGRPDIDSYGVFPADGAALVRRLQAGHSPEEAALWYRGTYAESVDIDEFVATLKALRFVGDGDEAPADQPTTVGWQRLGGVLFSPFACAAYVSLVLVAVALGVAHPALLPHRHNVFFSRYLVVIELTVLAGQLPLTVMHELAHVLAARRVGVRSRVRVSQRFYFVVFETILDGLVAVPRAKRYLPILAGMMADVLSVSALTVLAWLIRRPDGTLSVGSGVCLALAFTTLPRLIWQCYFFLRTDIYFLISTALGCVDLHTTTRELLRDFADTVLRRPRPVDPAGWHPRDHRVARWYAPLVVIGYAVSAATLALVALPLAWDFLGGAVRRVFFGAASSPAQVWDSAGLLALTLLQVVLAGVLAGRERRRTRSPQSQPAPAIS